MSTARQWPPNAQNPHVPHGHYQQQPSPPPPPPPQQLVSPPPPHVYPCHARPQYGGAPTNYAAAPSPAPPAPLHGHLNAGVAAPYPAAHMPSSGTPTVPVPYVGSSVPSAIPAHYAAPAAQQQQPHLRPLPPQPIVSPHQQPQPQPISPPNYGVGGTTPIVVNGGVPAMPPPPTAAPNYNAGGVLFNSNGSGSSLYNEQFPMVNDEERLNKKAHIIMRYRQMRAPVCEILNIQVPMTKLVNNEDGRGECHEIFDNIHDLLRYHSLVHDQVVPFRNAEALKHFLRMQNRTETKYSVEIYSDRFTELVEIYPTYDQMIDDLYETVEEDVRDVRRVVDKVRGTVPR